MTEPSKGAMRAAKVVDEEWFWQGWAAGDSNVIIEMAHIIDRETGSPLMLDALRQAATDLEAAAEYFDDASREHVVLMRLAAKVRAAIAAAENGDSQQGIARTQRDS